MRTIVGGKGNIYGVPEGITILIEKLKLDRTKVSFFENNKENKKFDCVTVVDKFTTAVEKETIRIILEHIKEQW